MSNHKFQVVESEHSPSVYISNYKAGVLLQKEKHLLDKNAKTVATRIKVDQKVLNRRFQRQLYHTKLMHARIRGDRKAEKELVESHLGALNTNMGSEQEESLQRIWSNTDDLIAKHGVHIAAKLRKNKPGNVQPEANEDRGGHFERPQTRRRPKSCVSIVKGKKPTRPVTAFEMRSKTKPQPSAGKESRESDHVTEEGSHLSDDSDAESEPAGTTAIAGTNIAAHADRPKTSFLSKVTDDLESGKAPPGDTKNVSQRRMRPHTSHPAGTQKPKQQPKADTKLDLTDPVLLRHLVHAALAAQKAALANKDSPFIGHDGWAPSLLDIQRLRVKHSKYESKVKQFGEKVLPLRANQDHVTDYYTLRVMEGARAGMNIRGASDEAPSESEFHRHTAHIGVRSMTFKAVNLDGRPVTCTGRIHVTR